MKTMKIILACALAFEQALLPVSSVFAQEDLPSADKNFAQDLQGPGGDEGGPILESGGSEAAPPATMPQGQVPGAPIESVQIGGGAPKDAPMYEEAESVSPLDRKIEIGRAHV